MGIGRRLWRFVRSDQNHFRSWLYIVDWKFHVVRGSEEPHRSDRYLTSSLGPGKPCLTMLRVGLNVPARMKVRVMDPAGRLGIEGSI